MKFSISLAAIFLSAILLTGLFFKQGIGLNLFLYEILFFVWLIFSKQLKLKTSIQISTAIGFLTTSLFTVLTYSIYSYAIHFLSLFLFIGVLNYSKVRSLFSVFGMSSLTLFSSQGLFIEHLVKTQIKGKRLGNILWKSRIFLAPVFIIFVFVIIYSFANPLFSDMVGNFGTIIQNGVSFIFEHLNFVLIFTFLFCLFLSVFLLYRSSYHDIEKHDRTASDVLIRKQKRRKRRFPLTALKNEYKAGLFLLLILNALLLTLNCMDVYWVWFNFEWEGQTLKEFVHEGTYLLIFSILISIALVLYFFRGNINFYSQNTFLKYLAYIWLFQNGVLAISVAIRNFYYIEHFAMAYKRIGVIMFLVLVLYGLFSVFKKIQLRRSAFHLFKVNAAALYAVLIISSLVNWDGFIADFNFKKAHKSYVHLEYLVELSDKALPRLDKTRSELSKIEGFQQTKFQRNLNDMTYVDFYDAIQERKESFKRKWDAKNFLSWNYAEYLAYQKLNVN